MKSQYFDIYMDLRCLHLFHLGFLCVLTSAKVLQFHSVKKNYTDAIEVCQSTNGNLAMFNEDIVKAAITCKMEGYAWFGEPWIKTKECYRYRVETSRSPYRLPNVSLIKCLSRCTDKRMKYIGLTVDTCNCYEDEDELGDGVPCLDKACPGNPHDKCGEGTIQRIYEKIDKEEDGDGDDDDDDDDAVCDKNENKYKQSFGIHMNNTKLTCTLQSEENSFFCLIDKDNKKSLIPIIDCGIQSVVTNLPDKTTGITVSQTADNTTRLPPTVDNDIIGIIGGIVGGVAMVFLVIGLVCLRMRNKSTSCKFTEPDPTVNAQPYSHYDLPTDYEAEKHTSDVYDHTSHSPLRHNDATGNNYDHTNNIKGVYNRAILKPNKKMVNGNYDYSFNFMITDNTSDYSVAIADTKNHYVRSRDKAPDYTSVIGDARVHRV